MPIKVHDIVPKFVSEKRNNEKPIYSTLYHSDPNISVKEPEDFLAAYSQGQTPVNAGEKTNILKAFYGGEMSEKKDKNYLSARGEEGRLLLPDKDKTSGDGSGTGTGARDADGIGTSDKSATIEPASAKKHFYNMHDIDSVYAGTLSKQTKVDEIHGGLAYLNVTKGGKNRKKRTKKTRKIKKKSRRRRKNKKRKKYNTKRRTFRK